MSCTELFVFGIYSTIIIGLLMAHQLQIPVRRPGNLKIEHMELTLKHCFKYFIFFSKFPVTIIFLHILLCIAWGEISLSLNVCLQENWQRIEMAQEKIGHSPVLSSRRHHCVISSILILNRNHFWVFGLRSCVESSFKFK